MLPTFPFSFILRHREMYRRSAFEQETFVNSIAKKENPIWILFPEAGKSAGKSGSAPALFLVGYFFVGFLRV